MFWASAKLINSSILICILMANKIANINIPFTKDYAYLPPIEFQTKCTFIGKTFYWVIREWFMEHGYTDLGNNSDLYFAERLYYEKRFAERDIKSRWRLKKESHERFGSSMHEWYIDVDIRCVSLHDVEVMHEGHKVKALAGEVRMELRAHIETDKIGLHKHWALAAFAPFFQKRLYKQEYENQRKELYRDVYRFHAVMKKFFELYIFTPDFELFHTRLSHA